MARGKIYIGTSGWSYPNWKGILYPPKTATKNFLAVYAKHYNTSEINSSFYGLPRQQTLLNWKAQVPKTFKFCFKMSRFLTHLKRLKNPEDPLHRFFTAVEPLWNMMGPVLIQLPASLKFDYDTASVLYKILRDDYASFDFALEPRDDSWFEDESIDLMRKHKITLVISESNQRFPSEEILTAKNIFIRFHGTERLYDSPHHLETLQYYAQQIAAWSKAGKTIWVFFNNTMHEHGLNNANTLRQLLSSKKK